METLLEVFSVLLGRYLFGRTGYYVRLLWLKIVKGKKRSSEFDEVIDVDDFKNRIVGFVVIMIIVVIIVSLE
jgi:hypothetical protein